MIRRWVLPVALLVVAFLLLPPPTPVGGQANVIRLATLVPDGSVWDRILREMGSEWSRSTEARVTLRIYPGGVAGDEPDIVRKMRIGQLQAAALTTAGLANIDPGFEMFGIPMFFDSYAELHAVLEKMEPILRQRLEAKGFVLLNWGHGGWVYFFTKNPVQTVADLKRAKMFAWAGDDQMVQLWRANGFQPVALAATDILTGLQTGMIDALPTTPLAALSLQWFRSTPYMVEVGIAPLVGGLVVTKQAWNRISAGDRTKILAACRKVERRLAVEVPRQDTTAVAEMQKRGLKIARVGPEVAQEWRATAEAFASRMRGGGGAADLIDQARRERDAFRQRQRSPR
jgi:TRAP-type C4-dicarboxylate transport system substrate-binding protein